MKSKALLAAAVCVLIVATRCGGDPKFRRYYNKGQQLYTQHCSNCHQDDGAGFKSIYPPLAKSDFMENSPDRVLCIMKNGVSGELLVNGVTFNQPMPGIPALTDLEVAEIATYIYNTWGNKRGIVLVNDASKVLTNCEQP